MDEWLWKKWDFITEQSDSLVARAINEMPAKMKKNLILCGGTSLHLYSTKIIFGDDALRASEDLDFFNRNSKLLENPKGVEESELARKYSETLKKIGFESEQKGRMVFVKPREIKVEFFYDSASVPEKTYTYKGVLVIHPKALYRIKIKLLEIRESLSERDLIDALYLSTKYGLPERIMVQKRVDNLLKWEFVENYLTEYGKEYFRKKGYDNLAAAFLDRVEVYEKD